MSFVAAIIILIVFILFLLTFSFGFFLGLSRKKKNLKKLEEEHKIQKQTQESIISYFLHNKGELQSKPEKHVFSGKIIHRGYRRIKRFLKLKKSYNSFKENFFVKYLRKYFLSYLGIAVLIPGIGLFVKYAVDSAYINIAGRFVMTLLLSAVLFLTAYRIFKKHKTFSAILSGGAIGILYVLFSVSYNSFELFSEWQVFLIYFIITFFSIILSLFYNRFELLLLAISIGFAAPLFSGLYSEDFVFLLLYLLLLDIGAVFISLRFKNFLVRLLPAVFSGAYFILIVRYSFQNMLFDAFPTYFWLINAIYIVLIILTVAYHIKTVSEYKLYELMMIVVVNLIYYSIGMYLLQILNPDYKGVFTAMTAAYNMLFLIVVILIKKSDVSSLIYFFGIVSLLFLTLIPPVQLVGKSITMIWAVETVLLMWVSIRLDIKFLRFISTILMLGLITSFAFDVVDNLFAASFNSSQKKLLINKSFISGLMTSFGLALNVIISGKSKDVYLIKPIKMSWLRTFISVVAVAALYVSLYTEILYRIKISVQNESLTNVYLGIYNFSFILLAMIVLSFFKIKFFKVLSGALGLISFVWFFAYYLYELISARIYLFTNPSVSANIFAYHLFMIAAVVLIFILAYLNISTLNRHIKRLAKWLLSFFIIAVLTSELDHFFIFRAIDTEIPESTTLFNTHHFHYSIFWMICSFALALSAFLFKDKELLRVVMVLLLLVIIKTFVFDFAELDAGKKIISFSVLGFVILFAAYVRQSLFEKIKKNSV